MSIDFALLAAPLAAGLLVLAIHVPLGIEVLRRGIIFIDLAIAQVAGLGVIVALLFDWDAPFAAQGAAAGAALGGALLLHWTERRWPAVQEALIGLLFVAAAAAGILLLAGNPHGGQHLQDLLAGQILWVGWAQLWPVALLYAVLLPLWFAARARLGRLGFYLLFALMVTASVQLVGVLLVFASLIAPAVAVSGLLRRRLVAAYGIGALAYVTGLALSAAADLPAGAAVVCCLVGISFLALATMPRRPASADNSHA
ncbi:MAG: metal ABC transporter permease [Gammaproteobacteria bacterium]|nr:metal ABC transporter permease [Rhodocyclaceae bacterium]MBU3910718.1 metal ABC transporter permease [Gammaproteobacteria bacterium]MBU3988496.1 metal ABC transporter permease [Gammaproteobacteria bacterium]MBU4003427.1 metal ABC transporter permease [Gammaproteobacteria bacterium]MBU4021898.1 metal ABC transporter permease [Gammaproteobacteria bacterium]